MKKLLCIILSALLIFILAACDTGTSQPVTIDPRAFVLNEDGQSYCFTGLPIETKNAELVIPGTYNDLPVTTITSRAFQDCTNLKSVVISEGITTIEFYAFAGCSNLVSVTLPESLTSIEQAAFSGCTSLKDIVIPNAVTTMGQGVFYYCSSLQSATLPSSLTMLDHSIFDNCTSLTAITIPDSVTTIYSSFTFCESLKSITIPDSVTTLQGPSFPGCSSLETIHLGAAVHLEEGSGGLISSTPNGIVMYNELFPLCAKLKNIEVDAANPYYQSIDGNLYSKDGTQLLRYASGKQDTVFTLPDSVTSINQGAFTGCEALETINIHGSVATIENTAFDRCTALTGIHFDGTMEQWKSVMEESETVTGSTIIDGESFDQTITIGGAENYTVYCTDGEIS